MSLELIHSTDLEKQCPLCGNSARNLLFVSKSKEYIRCHECDLIFLQSKFHLLQDKERSRYETHNNEINEQYLKYLKPTWELLENKILKNSTGLDYGCGPTKGIEHLYRSKGIHFESYDPYFHPSEELKEKKYDIITANEAAEHFYRPKKEFDFFNKALNPGGYLLIRTGIVYPEINFHTWWYKDDPTHVIFFSEETLEWIAKKYSWKLSLPKENYALFEKHAEKIQ